MRKLPKWKLAVIGLLSLMVVMFIVSLYRLATNPEGRYLFDQMGYSGLAYFEFKEGEIYLFKVQGRDLDGKVNEQLHCGDFSKESGEWVGVNTPEGERAYLRPGILSISILDTNGHTELELPRMWAIGNKVVRVCNP